MLSTSFDLHRPPASSVTLYVTFRLTFYNSTNDSVTTEGLELQEILSRLDIQLKNKKTHTSDALVHLTETWRRLVDEGNVVAVAFIDFKKAFDSVNHEILIFKLQQNFGICDSFLTWLKSYLNDRRQFTVVKETKSEFLPVNYPTRLRSRTNVIHALCE